MLVAGKNLLKSLRAGYDNIRPGPKVEPQYRAILLYELEKGFTFIFVLYHLYFIAGADEELMGLSKQESIAYECETYTPEDD